MTFFTSRTRRSTNRFWRRSSFSPIGSKRVGKVFEQYEYGAKAGDRPKVLDVSCGIGRHSINLAKLGYEAVGFDFSPCFPKAERRLAREAGLNEVLRFHEGDTTHIKEILESKGETNFAVICMDDSIARPTLREDKDLVRSIFKLAHEVPCLWMRQGTGIPS